MVKVRKDLTGKKFGRLTVLYQTEDYIDPKGRHFTRWHCICDCDEHNEIDVKSSHLQDGNVTSCGCLQRERVSKSRKKYNNYELNKYGIGYTSNTNEKFYFDLEDYNKIKNYCWRKDNNGYIVAYDKGDNIVRLHRLIMDCPKEMVVDHIDHNKMNNRRSNLRICTTSQNNMNRLRQQNNTSGYTGVSWDKTKGQWVASIKLDYCKIHLGCFNDIKDAIKARQEAQIKYFGEYRYEE